MNTVKSMEAIVIHLSTELQEFQEKWPALFAGTSLDEMTKGAICWRTVQNEKSKGIAPAKIFIRSGPRKLLVIRDEFLKYWQQKLTKADGTASRMESI
jgi:hypothetical protein